MLPLTLEDAMMIIQSLDATDWTYCGEGDRAKILRAKCVKIAVTLQLAREKAAKEDGAK